MELKDLIEGLLLQSEKVRMWRQMKYVRVLLVNLQ